MATTFYVRYPSAGGAAAANASVGTNAITAPSSSTQVAGVGADGNLHPLSTDNAGVQNVNVVSSALPSGAATSAAQTTGNTSLATIATNSGTQATAANQTTGNNSLATIATNTTGAATAANQTTGNSSLATIATNSGTQATSANQTTGNSSLATIATNSGTQATAANQTTGNSSLATIATNSSATQGTVAAGTAATKSDLVGGVFNTTLPTLTTGQQAAIQVDSSGRVIIAPLANTSIVKAQLQDNSGTAITVGSKVSASSVPVVIASDQAAVQVKPQSGTFTDRSGTTSATPSTSTTVAASNASRKYFIIQNNHASNTIWINFTTAAAATQPSIQLTPGSSYVMESSFISTEQINVICTVASSPFTAKEG